ncbi:hypothetical protein [Nonomuraea zeae]|uniref:hypothetical protein n=1 Tax=Nonomuraea zeae TaxID=1642303 RepID=UPI001981303C|nr:hypothetical protein [Nonomuraea zeae]
MRVGDTVHRTRDNRADFAARVLTYLESVGYPHAPRYLGIDERGRDILTFISGTTTNHPTQRALGAYARGGRMLRTLHETTAGHVLAAGQDCVIHGDPGPFNTIFQNVDDEVGDGLAGQPGGGDRPGVYDHAFAAGRVRVFADGHQQVQSQGVQAVGAGVGRTTARPPPGRSRVLMWRLAAASSPVLSTSTTCSSASATSW